MAFDGKVEAMLFLPASLDKAATFGLVIKLAAGLIDGLLFSNFFQFDKKNISGKIDKSEQHFPFSGGCFLLYLYSTTCKL